MLPKRPWRHEPRRTLRLALANTRQAVVKALDLIKLWCNLLDLTEEEVHPFLSSCLSWWCVWVTRTREVSFNSVAYHSHAAATMFWHAAKVTSLWHSLAVNILAYPIGLSEIMSWFQLLPLCSIVGETFPVYRMSTGIASWRGFVMIRCKVRRLNVLSY